MLLIFCSCSKENDFLDQKPDQSLVLPSSLSDYETLLNSTTVFNRFVDPAMGSASADEYYLPEGTFNSFSTSSYRNLYTWQKDIYVGESTMDGEWNKPYLQVYYCNIILEGIQTLAIPASEKETFNRIKGSALFFRAWAFYNLVQTFAAPYNKESATTDPGIPIKLSSDINARPPRSTVAETYKQIITDLEIALELLPVINRFKTQPSVIATLGFLSRIHLAMRNYEEAMNYSNKFLVKFSMLSDFNQFASNRTLSLHTTFLDEDVFHTTISTSSPSSRSNARIDPVFYKSYNEKDLRRTLFFRSSGGEILYKGSYDQYGYPYSGIATDEIMLNRAECYARDGKLELAFKDLNSLLIKRWAVGTFVPLSAATRDQALRLILSERKKELLFRGTRWNDLRRLNQEDEFKTTLSRTISGQTYTLPPNDPRYIFLIPLSEVQQTNISQNLR
ncbi:RagB/SusD family nutrient uptake outer membrane protein [Sphingobacterium detergens]|nr:RagB/SusD family nutrient uptake outer membrane protein [Sphingobacterium detergens]